MPTIVVAARAPSVALPRVPPAGLSANPRVTPSQFRLWRGGISFWLAELLRLVTLAYMLPIVIYAMCVPIAMVIKTVVFCAGWSLKALWP